MTAPIVQDARVVSIKFQKAIAPLLIIAGAVIAIVGGLLGWQIFQYSKLGVPIWVWAVAGLGLVYLFFTSDTGKKASGLAIQAGKVYVTKGALK